MDTARFQAILADSGIDSAPSSRAFLEWLGDVGIPESIIDHFAACVPRGRKRWLRSGAGLFTEEEIRRFAEEFPRLPAAGLLPVGSCVNGDPIAMDFRKDVGAVGYVSHEHDWEDESVRIRRVFVVVAPSLVEFARQAEGDLIPVDYWAAKRMTRS